MDSNSGGAHIKPKLVLDCALSIGALLKKKNMAARSVAVAACRAAAGGLLRRTVHRTFLRALTWLVALLGGRGKGNRWLNVILVIRMKSSKKFLSMTTRDQVERTFDTLWLQLGGQPLTPRTQVRTMGTAPSGKNIVFLKPTAPTSQPASAIEIDMGRHAQVGGRHVTSEPSYTRDSKARKLNTAQARSPGIDIPPVSSDMLRDDPVTHLGMIRDKIEDVLT